MTEEFTCPSCKETFPLVTNQWGERMILRDGDKEELEFSNVRDAEICRSCEESALQDASTIVRYGDGELVQVRFSDDQAMMMEPDYDDPPEWFWDIFQGRTYVQTDGWRGHYDTKFVGLVSLASGWVTGYPDETVARKITAIDLFQALYDAEISPPVPMYWLFEPTSNVFSTATEMLCRESSTWFGDWLPSFG